MMNIVLSSVVLGVAAAAPQGFPRDPAFLTAARTNFIAEYNRLAKLAADAPDIHIIMSDRRPDDPRLNTIPHLPAPASPHKPASVPAAFFENYGFTANLGGNQQFFPSANTFPAPPTHGGHLAGHLAGHQAPAPAQLSAPATAPLRWTGPLADTVPAGVHGLPQQVQDTPEVAAAKNLHFRALEAAFRSASHQPTHRF